MLSGLRVLEIGHFVAAPFCTRLLADQGADVIKIEPKTGDPVRQWGEMVDGKSLWWSMHGRNKRCITLNLKADRARQIVLDLVEHCDVLVENMRPGQLAKLGLSAVSLRAVKPDLVICHISGYGQTGPGRHRAAFGLIGEAVGGLRHLTNHAPGEYDLPPVRVGVSIGDSVAGIYAAYGIMGALWRRDRGEKGEGGLTVDVALTESVLSLMEGMLPEYGALGKIKQPTGGAIATAAPTNAYPTRDKLWILIGANSDGLFTALAKLMARPDLLENPDYVGNAARVRHAKALDADIARWTAKFDSVDLMAMLEEADIPSCKAYTAADCAADEQYRVREMIREVPDPAFGMNVLQAGVVPHIPESPGVIRWAGPDVGAHTDEVLSGVLAISAAEIEALRREGVV
ncbi:CaiB/BaiF CoA transferase family protein [Sphingobium sp.]|uniref:CaiB/BaiF CoA transferase family protein n=1 Tax=Sphingobium sp. TaxID=1912891 RepID=UPI003BB7FFD7